MRLTKDEFEECNFYKFLSILENATNEEIDVGRIDDL